MEEGGSDFVVDAGEEEVFEGVGGYVTTGIRQEDVLSRKSEFRHDPDDL